MAKLEQVDIVRIATEAGLENPRVFFRRLNDGQIKMVLKHGPDDKRSEIVFDRDVKAADVTARLAEASGA